MRRLLSLIALWGLLFSAACQVVPLDTGTPPDIVSSPAATEPATALPATPAQGDTTQMTPSPSTPAASGLEGLIEKAKEDLAGRLSILVAQISLVEAAGVVWPDSSMGCPQPGMRYKQVPADGALIILQVEGKAYEYHVGGSRGLFLCEKTLKDPNPPPKLDIDILTRTPTLDNGIPPGEDK